MSDQRFQTISNQPLEVQISGNKYLKADCIVSVTKTTHITMFKEIITVYVRIILNIRTHSVGKMQRFFML